MNLDFEEANMAVEEDDENNQELKKRSGGRPCVDLENASSRTLMRKFKPLDDLVERCKTTEGRIRDDIKFNFNFFRL